MASRCLNGLVLYSFILLRNRRFIFIIFFSSGSFDEVGDRIILIQRHIYRVQLAVFYDFVSVCVSIYLEVLLY